MALVPTNKRKLQFFFLVLLIAEIILAVLVRTSSVEQIQIGLESGVFVCPLRRTLGLLCAFCGMTHAWISIFQGKLILAEKQNLLALPFFIFANTVLFFGAAGYLIKIKPRVLKVLILISILSLSGYALARNIIPI